MNHKSVPFANKIEKLLCKRYFHIPLAWYIFALLVIVGMYLRFYRIEDVEYFGWDQSREAWTVRDILQGKLVLLGPKAGGSSMHVGPGFYYFAAPFYYFLHFNPMASNYYNIVENLFNSVAIFFVSKKIFKRYTDALFVIFVYTVSHYLIIINQIPWNDTLIPGLAALIFYSIWQIYQQHFKWFFVLGFCIGLYANLHFTFIYAIAISVLSLVLLKNKRKAVPYALGSVLIFLIWISPIILYQFVSKDGDTVHISDFGSNYVMGFHLKFFLYRLPDGLGEFGYILYSPYLKVISYLLLPVFLLLSWLRKQDRLFGYLIFLWFFVPLIGFTLYKGQISDYYFLSGAPFVLWIITYLQQRLLWRWKPTIGILIVFWLWFTVINTSELWIKPTYGGLEKEIDEAKIQYAHNEKPRFEEGDIHTYLNTIWRVDKQPVP